MNGVERPRLGLRLQDSGLKDGEIRLDDVAHVAGATQKLVTRLGRGLTGHRGPGRPPKSVAAATRLYLVGLGRGSTVLEIVGSEPDSDLLDADHMPADLGELVLGLVADGILALASSQQQGVLPVGFDAAAVDDLDAWLRRLRGYRHVSLDVRLRATRRHAGFSPTPALTRLRELRPQPALPYVSSTHQALEGHLYALNLRTGSFHIEDDARHSVRLSVPADLRSHAAGMVESRVRAIGTPQVDESGRLVGFDVADFFSAPEFEPSAQESFFERHTLATSTRQEDAIEAGVVQDLSDEEVSSFIAALAE